MEPLKAETRLAIVLPLRIKNILDYLVQKPLEWNAFGEVEEIKQDGFTYFLINDLAFPPQTNSGSGTEVSKEDFALFGETLAKQKKPANKYKFQVHSHNTMGAFWSGTDTQQMEDFQNKTYFLSMVISTKGLADWKACINLFSPVRLDIDIPIIVQDNITEQKELDKYKAELETVEKKREYTQPKWSTEAWWEKDYKETCKNDAKDQKKQNKQTGKAMDKMDKHNFSPTEREFFEEYMAYGYTPKQALNIIMEDRRTEGLYGYPRTHSIHNDPCDYPYE
jgi:hypothetical protein